MKTKKFEEHLDKALKDPQEAAAYLNAVAEDGDMDVLLLALADVARANGYTTIAKRSGLQREGIYKMLSHRGNPEFQSILRLLDASGLRMLFGKKKPGREKEAA